MTNKGIELMVRQGYSIPEDTEVTTEFEYSIGSREFYIVKWWAGEIECCVNVDITCSYDTKDYSIHAGE